MNYFPYEVTFRKKDWTPEVHYFFNNLVKGKDWKCAVDALKANKDICYYYHFHNKEDAIIFRLRFPCV
jgi:hypothetical protein